MTTKDEFEKHSIENYLDSEDEEDYLDPEDEEDEKIYCVFDIDWETDGQNVDLANVILFKTYFIDADEEIANYVSDYFDWLINSLQYMVLTEDEVKDMGFENMGFKDKKFDLEKSVYGFEFSPSSIEFLENYKEEKKHGKN